MAIDRQRIAVRLRIPDRRPPGRCGHGLCDAARAGHAHLSRRRAGGLAQRERRRLLEPAHARAAEEAKLLHYSARRDGHRPAQVARTVLWNDHRSTLDWEGRWREVGLAVRLAAANP